MLTVNAVFTWLSIAEDPMESAEEIFNAGRMGYRASWMNHPEQGVIFVIWDDPNDTGKVPTAAEVTAATGD